MKPALRLTTAFVAGALSVAGFAPFGVFVLPVLTLATLLWLVDGLSPRPAALTGYVFGLGWFLAGVSWVNVSLSQFGGMPLPLSLLATFLFCAYLALFPAAALAALRALAPSPRLAPVLFAALWVLGEWLRGTLFTGFPWLASGYAHAAPSPLAGYVPVFGVHGAGFVAALMAGLLAAFVTQRLALRQVLLSLVALLAGGALLGAVSWTTPTGRTLTVSLLQGNIEQSMKWVPERLPESMNAYLDLARAWPADLVVLPETAVPLPYDEIDPRWLEAVRATGRDVLMGAVTVGEVDGRARYFNSARALGRDDAQYSKAHLVPFGEFTPPLFAWTLKLLSIPMSDFGRGAAVQPPLELAGEKVAVNICYEDVFGEELIAGAREATLLVNVSNTAWFGDSWAQPQHLQIAQLRALELGRPMLRATNTGMTAAIQPDGRVIAALPPFSRAGLRVELQGYQGLTPFLRWGNAPVLLLSLAVLIVAAVQRKKG
ncbi:Apolipoprotein N-acyltransferase [Methyloversatilis universalis FAM5]|uniref:Apolipoprotein N-acyltransferase n=1 Tax=Methyloversatilis universalis (strain ATCC BAA-1314 / DSM 25237 / JCM 13912 / CCUG 52030 / FAM5) TaxID=1000565 RepID=F5RCV2_METUF|nr:apolipoprotein N-acyltransferase [Methyloversatilis universalis]EGK71603.1 Apolipoprotein N-acyltransferase [Methyloversatilis universalis FAM5]